MSKVDKGEFYNPIENKQFDEFKSFPAEQYYSLEVKKLPLESAAFNEENANKENSNNTNAKVKKDSKLDEARKQYDNMNSSDGSQVPNNVSSSSSGSSFSSSSTTTTASSTTSSTTTVASTSSTAATTSSVASIATSAVVVITAVTTFFTFQKEYVQVETGDDYSTITINIDDVIKGDNGLHGLSFDDFVIQFNMGEENKIINFERGKHTYLVTGLEPNKTYSYDVICNNSTLEKNNVCYSGQVTTTNTKKSKCVYDEMNNSISYDDESKSGIINYSIYLSDYYSNYTDYSLYICSEPQDNKSNIKNVIYESNQLNEENYFIGSVSNITYDEVYFYVVGYGEIEEVLYSSTLEMNLPQEFVTNTNPILDFNKNNVSCSNDSNVVMIEGTYSYYDSTKNLEVCVNEYDSLGNIIQEKNNIPLVIDDNNKRFSFSFEAKYGNDSFDYTIYYRNSSNRLINVFNSNKIKSNINFAFEGIYTKALPKDATVIYLIFDN